VSRRVDRHRERLPRRDRLLARVAHRGREPGYLGANAERFGTAPDRGGDEAHRDRDDHEGDDQLEEGEASGIYL